MADKLMRVQATIALDSAVPEDSIVNVWHFDGDDGNTDAAYWSGAETLLQTFYQSIDGALFPSSVGTTVDLKMYDLRDAPPRVPEFTSTITIAPGAGDPLPGEVAVCLSYAADFESGVPNARRRGRIFIGPIAQDNTVVISSQLYLDDTARHALADAGEALMAGTALPDAGSIRWAVYSPRTDLTGTIDDAFNDVTSGWVDNAFDTQRRRGPKATLRTVFP